MNSLGRRYGICWPAQYLTDGTNQYNELVSFNSFYPHLQPENGYDAFRVIDQPTQLIN